MPESTEKKFNDAIQMRLESREWSSSIAGAVMEKSAIHAGDKFFGLASWVVPMFSAAASVIIVITIALSGTANFTYADVFQDTGDYTGQAVSEVDSMLEYVYYGRE